MDRNTRSKALILSVVAIAVDQYTKWLAMTTLLYAGGHMPLPGPVDFTLTFNESNAFGLAPVIGQTTRWVLMAANLGAAAVSFYFIVMKQIRPLTMFGLSLIMAGAIGNAIDRALIGSVVDFFDATKIGFGWIFNVADVSLNSGMALLILSTFLNERRIAA